MHVLDFFARVNPFLDQIYIFDLEILILKAFTAQISLFLFQHINYTFCIILETMYAGKPVCCEMYSLLAPTNGIILFLHMIGASWQMPAL